jgi:hypothetical protein
MDGAVLEEDGPAARLQGKRDLPIRADRNLAGLQVLRNQTEVLQG